MIIVKEIFETIVSGMTFDSNAINFKFGYWAIVANELLTDGKSPSLASQRFPLIFLHAEFDEEHTDYRTLRINPIIYIITQTETNYDIDKRFEFIYKPILYPIYLDLLTKMRQSQKFWIKPPEILHTKKDLFYLQNKTATQNNLMQIVDAIEIKFNQLDLIKSNCYYKSI